MKAMRFSILFGVLLISAQTALAVSIETEIPASEITPTASSIFSPLQDVNHLVNGAGLNGDTHDNDGGAQTMWHTAENPAATTISGIHSPAWVRFDFSKPETFAKILIWNHNQAGMTERGFRKTKILGTTNGTTWITLAETELPRANGGAGTSTAVMLAEKQPLKSVVIAAISNWGSSVYGLSAVQFVSTKDVSEADLPFPNEMQCVPQAVYRHRADGQAGREIKVSFKGTKLYTAAQWEMDVDGQHETVQLPANAKGTASAAVLLPPGVGVDKDAQIFLTLKSGTKSLRQSFMVPKQRQWTVYIYPHSHVDIGYTNTQANVEIIHNRNLIAGMKLATDTANYPDGSRYLWNPEVIWPVERYLKTATPEQKAEVLDAIRKGYVHLDAGYINDNTSVSAGEELFSFFSFGKTLAAQTSVPIDTMVQVDVPGMSWGIVPAAAQQGIRYIFALFNGSDRTGLSRELNFHPFWWVGPDGKSKVLFLQPGDYTPGARLKGMPYAIAMMGQTDPAKLPPPVKTNNPRANFIDGYLFPTLNALQNSDYYPYDIFTMSWAMADNTPIDADLPDAVKSWNDDYAYPHLVIASAHQIMDTFAQKYGDKFPTYRGDFTEYWTDGLGTAAKQTGMNRASKERLIQADTLWSMLHRGQPAPRAPILLRPGGYVILGSEHTWCFSNPWAQPISNTILQVKFSYFQTSRRTQQSIADGKRWHQCSIRRAPRSRHSTPQIRRLAAE